MLRPGQVEGGDDGHATGAQGAVQRGKVARLVGAVGQKVEHRPVMPQVIGAVRCPVAHICRDQRDRSGPKPLACDLQRRGGQVQNRYRTRPVRQNMIDQPRRTTTRIEQRTAMRQIFADQGQGLCRFLFEPCQRIFGAGSVGRVPVR